MAELRHRNRIQLETESRVLYYFLFQIYWDLTGSSQTGRDR
jgi:hypothetical protein